MKQTLASLILGTLLLCVAYTSPYERRPARIGHTPRIPKPRKPRYSDTWLVSVGIC